MAYSAAHQGQLTHQYDLASRRRRLTWPDGFYVTYEYDLADAAVRETGATSGRVRLNSPHMPICAAAFTWLGPASYYADIVDTFKVINGRATKEGILGLKKYLQQTSTDDIVICHVPDMD